MLFDINKKKVINKVIERYFDNVLLSEIFIMLNFFLGILGSSYGCFCIILYIMIVSFFEVVSVIV